MNEYIARTNVGDRISMKNPRYLFFHLSDIRIPLPKIIYSPAPGEYLGTLHRYTFSRSSFGGGDPYISFSVDATFDSWYLPDGCMMKLDDITEIK